MDVCRVALTLKLRKGAFCSLLRLGIVLHIEETLTSYAPNLIADSGITLMTFKPFPSLSARAKEHTRLK